MLVGDVGDLGRAGACAEPASGPRAPTGGG